jgi:glycerol-3-phosphate dehydrogenase (NAD(P)+)
MENIAIIGGGSWGTALGLVLSRARCQHRLKLWVHDPALARSLGATRVNEIYLPGFVLPREVAVTNDLGEAAAGADLVLGVMPSAHAPAVYRALAPHLARPPIFVSATKGLQPGAGGFHRPSEVIEEIFASRFPVRVAALSGPSFAREVARGDPTAVVIASRDLALARTLQEEFSGPTFRLYTNDDVVGTELGGAVKNVIAIAAGVCVGLGFGHNTIAALITRGAAEIARLGCALGARRETLAGLAGIGDLVLTATGSLSRNRAVGVALGKGRKLEEILGSMRMVAEGVGTTAATLRLAEKLGIEMPITAEMHAVLDHARAPLDAIRALMERPLKQE